MRLGEADDDFGHVAVRVVVRCADPQRSLETVVVEGGDRLIVEADHPAGKIEEPVAFHGQPVAPAILHEKRLADPFFQASHLHRYGGLSLEDTVGRLGEAARVCDCYEGLQLVNIERCGHGRNTHKIV